MERREPLELLRNRLLRRGLPAAYVTRAVQELADHHADLVDGTTEPQQAWKRLGDVELIGEELVHKFRARTFAGRHPLLTFAIAPLPAVILLWVAMFFASWTSAFAIAGLLGNQLENYVETDLVGASAPFPMWLLLGIHYACLYIPPAVGAWWFCRLATRSGRGIVWGATACLVVAGLALFAFCELKEPQNGQPGMLTLGLWLPLFHRFAHLKWQLLQAVAPLAVLVYMAWQARRLEKTEIALPMERRVAA